MAGRQRPLDVADVAHVHEGEREAQLAVDPLHQPVGAAVHVLAADDVVARPKQLEDRVERREPGAEGEAVGRPLEAGHVALERLAGGVLGAGVLVALVLAERRLHVGRGLVDRAS